MVRYSWPHCRSPIHLPIFWLDPPLSLGNKTTRYSIPLHLVQDFFPDARRMLNPFSLSGTTQYIFIGGGNTPTGHPPLKFPLHSMRVHFLPWSHVVFLPFINHLAPSGGAMVSLQALVLSEEAVGRGICIVFVSCFYLDE